ncbi:MAG: SDR family NAD(P)-dependent oxidoreductase [Planctomycetaceae bacterium]
MADASSRVALVTGSATGVGRACAVRFAKLGFDVVVNYTKSEPEARETVSLVEAAGRRALLIRCNVRDDAEVRAMIGAIEQQFGRLDVVVNNAAMTYFVEHADLDGMSEDKWDDILAVNVKGPFFVTRAALPLLKKSGAGAVVNVSSTAGVVGLGSCVAYCASKGALNTMTKSLARALAPEVRVNSVCPGPINSRWLLRNMTPDELQAMTDEFPIPRPAEPDDIADAVVYLATGTSLTTGQLLVVDGGRTM